MKISYISNILQNEASGGMSGINNAVFNRFKEHASEFSYQYINPSVLSFGKLISQLSKIIGFSREYYYFSESRLDRIESIFVKNKNCDFYFFHGFTPWIKIKPDKPYFCFNDGCFGTYLEHYNNKKEFKPRDLQRIFDKEKIWLNNACAVFFQSDWALNETKKHYNTKGENFYSVGVGGFIDIPEDDSYNGKQVFLFIAREFIAKGGIEAVKAIQLVRTRYPDATLLIVGEKPDDKILKFPGIVYVGFLNKNVKEDLDKLKKVFSHAFALVHPTVKDINPLVINELAYFGCPAISSNRFAIPEYLINNKTGLLVNDPRNVDEIASKMLQLLNNKGEYNEMRKQARLNAISNNTWDNVLNRIVRVINDKV